MNPPDENPRQTDNSELLKEQTPGCAADCACPGTWSSEQIRWALGMIVLLIAATLLARAVVKNHARSAKSADPVFVTLAPAMRVDSQSPASPDEALDTTGPSVGERIASLSELNSVARVNDAVFVSVPAKDGASGNPPSAALQSAASRIEAQGYKIALFTLAAGSRDHAQLAAQMSGPGVLAMVKGKGMSAVAGEITEAKLIQGFVAAANCGPGGCGPAGCCPTGSK